MTLWTVAHKAPLSMGISRQEYWSGLPFPSSQDLPGIEPGSLTFQADSLLSELPGQPTLGHGDQEIGLQTWGFELGPDWGEFEWARKRQG